jgi:hypothetical protein
VRARALPDEVVQLRQEVAEEHKGLDALLQPSIDVHIAAYSVAVDEVIAAHRVIAEETDIAIRANTRWSAIWELSGRCLAVCRVVLHDLRGGFTSEAVGSLRALYEASVLLGAVAFHGDEDAVRRWLEDDVSWVRPQHARSVMQQKEELAHERMRAQGIEPEGQGLTELGGEIYDLLSRPAHHRRGGFPETTAPELREFVYGPHPNAEVRARHVSYAGELIETALIVVIDSLGDILGRDYAHDALPRMQQGLEAVRNRFPLP